MNQLTNGEAVKDLLHPAGHIFFGEVAIKKVIVSADTNSQFGEDETLQNVNIPTDVDSEGNAIDNSLDVDVIFRPTIVIHGDTEDLTLSWKTMVILILQLTVNH